MSAKQYDQNGFIEVKGNPISKVGIFDYLGREIGAPDPDRIYKVLRPAEELSKPETIKSFELLPFTNDHAMLGSEDAGLMPAEKKGVHGTLGQEVYFEHPYLKSNIKIFSEFAKDMVERKKKFELSPGYRCTWDFTSGVYDGQHYDAVQRDIMGNHLALVAEGRTGPDVAVLDHACYALDMKSIEEAVMADENKTDGAASDSSAEEIRKLIDALSDEERAQLIASYSAKDESHEEEEKKDEGKDSEVDSIAAEAIAAAESAAAAVVEAAEEVKEAAESLIGATDSAEALKKLHAAQNKLAQAKGVNVEVKQVSNALDAASVIAEINERNQLKETLKTWVGAFDSACTMTSAQIAEYGVQKLGIPCAKGSEKVALSAYLHGRTAPSQRQTTSAQDGKVQTFDFNSARGIQ